MPLLQERVIAAFFLSLFLAFYGGKTMKIYVKESKSLSIQTESLMFYDSVTIVPLLSLDDVLYSDLIIVSQSDVSSMTGLEEYHVIIYEQLFQELSVRGYQEYYNNHDYYYLKNALQQAQNTNITTLISGSSYGAFGIDLEYIDNAVNMSSISQDLYYSIKLLCRACETNRNIRNIVLCVGHYCFFSDLSLAKTPSELQRISKVYYPLLHDSHNCLILPPKDEYYMQGNLIDFEKVINAYAATDYKDGFFNEKRPRNRCATVVWNAVSKSWSELSTEEKDQAGKTRAESHNKAIKHTASFNENLGVFQDFVYFCNDRGINLLLTAMPASSQYLKYLTPEYKNIFYSVLDKVDGTVHLLDLVEDSSFDNSFDFNDTDHLNDSGARKLSQMISSILNEINN